MDRLCDTVEDEKTTTTPQAPIYDGTNALEEDDGGQPAPAAAGVFGKELGTGTAVAFAVIVLL